MALHLIKLCVGCDTVEELIAWWRDSIGPDQPWKMRTRQTPKRAAELVDGGSLYHAVHGLLIYHARVFGAEKLGPLAPEVPPPPKT